MRFADHRHHDRLYQWYMTSCIALLCHIMSTWIWHPPWAVWLKGYYLSGQWANDHPWGDPPIANQPLHHGWCQLRISPLWFQRSTERDKLARRWSPTPTAPLQWVPWPCGPSIRSTSSRRPGCAAVCDDLWIVWIHGESKGVLRGSALGVVKW